MPDHAVSDDPAVQRQLDRLSLLSPGADVLGLSRIAELMRRLDHPERSLPPVLHVAGTNGKGSTCAFLRAALEAGGHKVHVFTSPHLVRFNERIRLAGALIDDAWLASLLDEVLSVGGDIGASFFEVTTAAAFLAFARTPADACIVEVGLGGRLDATNVVPAPIVCGIAQLGLDHQAFLGDTIEVIAGEKAGIAKPGVPLLTMHYPVAQAERIGAVARAARADWRPQGHGWDFNASGGKLHYHDEQGALDLSLPRLAGLHQAANLALATAMLRHQHRLTVKETALRAAPGWAEWPARLQPLRDGGMRDLLPEAAELWLDGGHNPAAARAIAGFLAHRPHHAPLHLVIGLLANKDVGGFLAPFEGSGARVRAVPVPGHEHHAPAAVAALARAIGLEATEAPDVPSALGEIGAEAAGDPVVLVAGSLYLAGTVLAANGTPPS